MPREMRAGYTRCSYRAREWPRACAERRAVEGQTKVPSIATLEKLAQALGVKVGRLLE
jgi:hypothetical protein